MLDSVKVTLILGLAAVVFGVVLLACFAYMNTGSRNISFAVAALGASTAMLLLTLSFDLQGSTPVEPTIPTEYTIDARTSRLRQWVYPSTLGDRYMSETTASTEALQTNPEMFAWDNGENLAHNMIIFSILSYFIFEQHDWQTKKDVVAYSDSTVTQTSFASQQNSCGLVTYDELRKALSDSGNIFSTFKWYSPFNTICLPPETTISITSSSVAVSNPFCKIVFDVERSGGFAGHPTRRGDNPMLENGKPQFWTWRTPIRVTTQYSFWRAQHRDKQKYQDWAHNLVEGVRRWFGTVTDHSTVSFDADEENSGNGLKYVTTEMRN